MDSTVSAPPMPLAMPLSSQDAWTPYRLLTSTVWVHPVREAARAKVWRSTGADATLCTIHRTGCQSEKTTLHDGQSRSWSAEQGKYIYIYLYTYIYMAAQPPLRAPCSFGENIIKTPLRDLPLLFVYFQVNNDVLYVLAYLEDTYIRVLSLLVSILNPYHL